MTAPGDGLLERSQDGRHLLVATEPHQPPGSDLDLHVLRSIREVEGARTLWEQLRLTSDNLPVSTDLDRFLSWVRSSHGSIQPRVLVILRGGRPVCMVLATLQDRKQEIKVGYAVLCRPTLSCLSVAYGGILGEADEEVQDYVIRCLVDRLRRGEADQVMFSRLALDSPRYRAARRAGGWLTRGHIPRVDLHWWMTVPRDIEAFYRRLSGARRRELKRTCRQMEAKHSGQVRHVTYRTEAEVDVAVSAISKVSRTTWQHALGRGFAQDAGARERLVVAARHGWMRLSVLYVGQEPVAFQTGLVYGRTYLAEQIGYDPRWSRFSVGTILFLKVLEELCADPRVEILDFDFGDADYKHSFGQEYRTEAYVLVFAPRLRPICINTLVSLSTGLHAGAKALARRTGLGRHVKKLWRGLARRKRGLSGRAKITSYL